MALHQRAGIGARAVLVLLATAGCRLPAWSNRAPSAELPAVAARPAPPGVQAILPGNSQGGAQPVAQRLPPIEPHPVVRVQALFASQEELSLERLLAEVEARNPSVQAMVFAWQAAAQRYPQVVSLDDPMFMTMMAPGSFNSNQVNPAFIVSGTQKIPWFGKRDLRGQAAQSEAGAAFHDAQDTRLQIAQITRVAFYEYYLVERQRELNIENREVMLELGDSARAKYENNQVTQQDVFQADLEVAEIDRRQLELDRMRRVAVARINTLLRGAPGDPLPPPPQELDLQAGPADAQALRQIALTQRPDLAALSARVRAAEAAVDLALKQFYPDTEFFGRYDSFWQPTATQNDLRAQIGVNMNVPIYRRRLNAAVCEAEFRLSQRRAEYQQRQLDIEYEVQSAYEQVDESRRAAALYHDRQLTLAERNLAAARTNYDVGQINFLFLAQAQRQLISVREKYQQALADYHRRLADLERAVGGRLAVGARPKELPTVPTNET